MEDNSEKKNVKLPYFHRTLSPEDSALIGDITPKPIALSSETASGKISDGSAWNSAKTWEERDCSQWAREKLKKTLSEKISPVMFGSYTLTFSSWTDVIGDAQITHIRGKARFLFEMSFTGNFSLKNHSIDKIYEGKLAIVDVINDQLDDMELSITSWSPGKSPPTADLKEIKSFLTGSNVKKALKAAVDIFSTQYTEI